MSSYIEHDISDDLCVAGEVIVRDDSFDHAFGFQKSKAVVVTDVRIYERRKGRFRNTTVGVRRLQRRRFDFLVDCLREHAQAIIDRGECS